MLIYACCLTRTNTHPNVRTLFIIRLETNFKLRALNYFSKFTIFEMIIFQQISQSFEFHPTTFSLEKFLSKELTCFQLHKFNNFCKSYDKICRKIFFRGKIFYQNRCRLSLIKSLLHTILLLSLHKYSPIFKDCSAASIISRGVPAGHITRTPAILTFNGTLKRDFLISPCSSLSVEIPGKEKEERNAKGKKKYIKRKKKKGGRKISSALKR